MVFKTIPSAWLDHGMGNIAMYCFHFICRCQFQGLLFSILRLRNEFFQLFAYLAHKFYSHCLKLLMKGGCHCGLI